MERELDAAPQPAISEPAAAPAAAAAPLAPGPLTPATVLRLQGSLGNAAVSRILARETTINGDPSDVAPTSSAKGTVLSLPQMNDTTGPMDAEDAGDVKRVFGAMLMKPKATKESPLVTSSSAFPGWDGLVEHRPDGPAADGFVSIGVADQPQPELKMTDSLYIGTGPTADDVQQGMVGDCWDLAVVAAIAGRDPGKIMSVIRKTDTGVAATFFRKTSKMAWGFPPKLETVYDPVTVNTSGELLFNVDEAGRNSATVNGRRELHGAKLRHGAKPVDKRWWVEIAGDKAIVRSRATYDVARWAPLLEKAFAMFAAEYGQYGGTGADGEKSGGKGTAPIEGGFEKDLFAVFYGAQGDITEHPENVPSVDTTFSPGTNVLIDNIGVINQLLPVQGLPDQMSPKDLGNVPLVTAATTSEVMFKRLADCIDMLVGFEEYEKLIGKWTRDRIRILREKLRDRAEMFPAAGTPAADLLGTEAKTKNAIASAARVLVDRIDGQDLFNSRTDPRMGTISRDVVDLALDACNAGTDHSGGQRNVYGEHAYTVISARFADSGGKTIVLPNMLPGDKAQLGTILAPVSQEQSTVRLRNPHHGNEPDEKGDGAPARPDNGPGGDGIFNMNLTQFMMNFASVSSFVAPHS